MHRLIVALLAAFDALLAAAVGVVVVLAPLTLLWALALHTADWSGLWPATASVWQLAHLVPLAVTLPVEYLVAAGIPTEAAAFAISLAPLALTVATAVLAARSGLNSGRSGSPATGAVAGTVVFAAAATGVALTAHTAIVAVPLWQAILMPTLVFAVPAVVGAFAGGWSQEHGAPARLRVRIARMPAPWRRVPALAVRGAAVGVVALLGIAAATVAVAVVARGGEVLALYESANLDLAGVIVVSLAQLAYLPTLVVWALAFLAGPGFAVGAGTAVSPAGTQLGVVPGIPVMGALPAVHTPWLLVVVLLVVGAGALAGGAVRRRMPDAVATPAMRAAVAAGIAAGAAAAAALLAAVASGSIGPGGLAEVGPVPGAVALAVGIEVLAGAAAVLFAPARDERGAQAVRWTDEAEGRPSPSTAEAEAEGGELIRGGARVGSPATARRAGPTMPTAPVDAAPPHAAADAADEDDVATVPVDPGFFGDDGNR